MNVTRSIDTSTLEAPQAHEVEHLISQLDLADLARRSPLRGGGADRFQYDLSVQAEGQRYDVTLAEDVAPPELKELLAWMLQHDGAA